MWYWDKMATILQTTFSHLRSFMEIFVSWFKFHWNLFPRDQLTVSQHCVSSLNKSNPISIVSDNQWFSAEQIFSAKHIQEQTIKWKYSIHKSLLSYGDHIDGLAQERRNSIANTLELHLYCTKPSKPSGSLCGISIGFGSECLDVSLNNILGRISHEDTLNTFKIQIWLPDFILGTNSLIIFCAWPIWADITCYLVNNTVILLDQLTGSKTFR